jgi:hypothetical protein
MPASDREREDVARRRARVLRLRIAGMGYAAIADEVDGERQRKADAGDTAAASRARYSERHAAMDVRRALASAHEQLAELADLHLVLELERLDSIYRTAEGILRRSSQAGDQWQALRALDRQLAVARQRDSLLGLSRTTEGAQETAAAEGRSTTANAVDQLARKRAARASGR